jgi:hypothetical protein
MVTRSSTSPAQVVDQQRQLLKASYANNTRWWPSLQQASAGGY